MKRTASYLVCLLSALFSNFGLATNSSNGNYYWQFLSGQSWPDGYNRNIGKPDNLMWSKNEYDNAFFERIQNALPERQVNEAFLTDDEGSTIHLSEEAEVFITFIHEGAGYKNSFGYFVFDKDNPPTSHQEVNEIIVFPNLSYPHMTNGHRVSLGVFPAGTSIGFFIAANGFSYYTGVKSRKVPYYYTLQNLNPESDPSLRQHAVLLYDEEVSEVILGFEDLPRNWGDNDFNDAVFSVKSSPESAIDPTVLVSVPDVDDRDADGVSDDLDEFPDDYRRAYSSYFPSEDGLVTLAYEDNWPNVGDFDFNDLVIKERLRVTYNASGLVSGFVIDGQIAARGASRANGFALQLLDVLPEEIEHANLTIQGKTYAKSTDKGQQNAVIRLWRNTHAYTTTGKTGTCSHFNTNKSCEYFDPIPFSLDVRFTNAKLALLHSQFDFFLFRTHDYSWEIHMADFAPTDWFRSSRFGRSADTSNPIDGRYFRTSNNAPWAIQIADDWEYPREYIDVLWAYPDFQTWAESEGAQSQDWYRTSERKTHFYSLDK